MNTDKQEYEIMCIQSDEGDRRYEENKDLLESPRRHYGSGKQDN